MWVRCVRMRGAQGSDGPQQVTHRLTGMDQRCDSVVVEDVGDQPQADAEAPRPLHHQQDLRPNCAHVKQLKRGEARRGTET